MSTNKLGNYLALLTIRQAAERRNTNLIGGIFIVSFTATIALGMLDRLSGRSLYLVTAMVVVFALAYLQAWVKFQITNRSKELIENLQFQ